MISENELIDVTSSNTPTDMRILNAEFVKSIAVYEEANSGPLPEVCFIGRSNVGKSSMINSLVLRKVALTSSPRRHEAH